MLSSEVPREMMPRLTNRADQCLHRCGDTSLPLATVTSSKQQARHFTDGSVYTETVICFISQLGLDPRNIEVKGSALHVNLLYYSRVFVTDVYI